LPLSTNFGFVMFSGAEPGTHIAPHYGSSNLRLRHHLGIEIPEPEAARIRVGTEWRQWKQGRAMAFDDSFEHEVEHEGKKLRIVLSVDVWHPSLTAEDIAVLSHPVFRDFGYARG
jgi:aspartate beta-hydroxylase